MEKKLFTTAQAAEYLGLTRSEMLNEVNYRKSIPSRLIGRARIFSRKQLEDWKANGGHTKVKVNGRLFSMREAAKYLGISYASMKKIYYTDEEIPAAFQIDGTVVVFGKKDLDKWLKDKAAAEVGPARAVQVPKRMVIPAHIKEQVDGRVTAEDTSMYQVIAELWQEWVGDERRVAPLVDAAVYRVLPKKSVYVRVDEELATAVDEKCAREDLKISYVTAQLLAQWADET